MSKRKGLSTDRSFDLAERTRDPTRHKGFLAGLFEGEARFDLLHPYPEESLEDLKKLEPVREALKTLLWEKVDSEAIDAAGEIPDEVFTELTRLKLWGVKIPEEHGGLGFSQSNYRHLAVLSGGWDGNFTALFSAHNSIGTSQPLLHGSDEQKARLLPRIAAGAICGLAITEEEAGSDFTRIRTYAKRLVDPETGDLYGYELSGKKLYTTNGPKNDHEFLAKFITVIARIVDDPKELDDPAAPMRFGAFVVDTASPGARVLYRCHFMGLRAIYNGVIGLEKVFVHPQNLIGEEGDGVRITLATLAIGRLTLPAAICGGFKQALSVSRWWAAKRIQWFNRRIGDHELIAKKLDDMAAHLFALEAMVGITCARVDQKQDVRLESAACKVLGSKWFWDDVNEALQIRSGRGYETAASLGGRSEEPIPLEQMLRDSRINLIFEGTNEIMRLWQAREELDYYVQRALRTIGDRSSTYGRSRFRAIVEFLRPAIRMRSKTFSYRRIPKRLRPHLHFVERDARNLARVSIAATLLFQKKLVAKQLVSAKLADDAMGLFAIAASCSYAARLYPKYGKGVVELADYACWELRKQIHPASGRFAQVFRDPNRNRTRKLAKMILAGELAWLEEGILPFLKKYGIEQ